MSVPQIPPRPSRSQHQHPPSGGMDIPTIPPRPQRRPERSHSPNRDNFARSPFNEPPPPLGMTLGNRSGGFNGSNQDASSSNLDLPQRPPSVSLPTVGQEGNEYADIDYSQKELDVEPESKQNEPKETRNIAGDLPLHAPRPSFSKADAKARVSTVTRTDSTQAAAAGIGKVPTPIAATDDHNPQDHPLKPRVSFRTASSASTERPPSAAVEDDHGIPEIGQRVPMYPDAGDVQAPSPSPYQAVPIGIGFHNSGAQKPSRNHRRTPSGREVLPPGSYGMHGHGVQSTDHFEKEWYEKHPDELQKEEHGEYGPGIGGGRGEWALSSDDLNKLVRETSKSSSIAPGLPNEQFGYQASENYASRMQTPATWRLSHSNHSQPHVESPLRKASFPADIQDGHRLDKSESHDQFSRSTENALESETEDEDVHIAPPKFQKSKYTGSGYDPPTEDLGPAGGNTSSEGGFIEERGYGVPILASDEVAKTPGAEWMQPAIPPAQERRGSDYQIGAESDQGGLRSTSRSGSASNSRPTSRPGSIYSLPGLSRFSTHDEDRENMHTPLEDVDEYEPLFPDEDGNKQRKPVSAADRLKLREQMKRFPSQDIWEDTPNSLQLQATVDTPEPINDQGALSKKAPTKTFETPEQEAARKGEVTEEEKRKLIPREERLAKSHFKPHVLEEAHRPGLKQRFPSRDIWEDSPDSANLSTTIGESPLVGKAQDEGLEAGAVVRTTGAPAKGIIAGEQSRDGVTAGAPAMERPSIPPRPIKAKTSVSSEDAQVQPTVPARPPRRLHQVPPADAQVPAAPSQIGADVSPTANKEASPISPVDARRVPSLPDRPKPQVSARPARPIAHDSSESVPLSKIASASSVGSEKSLGSESMPPPPAPKPKPAVPARPAGSKIAALKGGFLADLDSRLKLGPQGPKPQEKSEPETTEEEKAPLADARKGRAKGPSRRKPVIAPTAESVSEAQVTGPKWTVQQPVTTWETDERGGIKLHNPTSLPKSKEMPEKDDSISASVAEATGTLSSPTTAVEEPLKPSLEHEVQASGKVDLATPATEREHNPLSIEPNTPEPDTLSATNTAPIDRASADTDTQAKAKDLALGHSTVGEEKGKESLEGDAQVEGGSSMAGSTSDA